MRITITADDGEIYTVLRDVELDRGEAAGKDEEGEVVAVSDMVKSAAVWEKNRETLDDWEKQR